MWFAGNLLSVVLRQMDVNRIPLLLGISDSIGIVGLGLLPPLTLHTHWVYYRRTFAPSNLESRIAAPALLFLYAGWLAIPWSVGLILADPLDDPLESLSPVALPFLISLAISYFLSAFYQSRILKRSQNPVEKRLFRRLLPVFICVPAFNFVAWMAAGEQGWQSPWLVGARLTSLIPGTMVAYFVYYHRFLRIVVRRSISSAFLIVLVLSLYLFGVRRLDAFLQNQMSAPPFLTEAIFLAVVLLSFPSLSGRLETQVEALLSRQFRRYRKIGELVQSLAPSLISPRKLADFVEEQLRAEIPSQRIAIHLISSEAEAIGTASQTLAFPSPYPLASDRSGAWIDPKADPGSTFYPLRSGDRVMGYIEVDSQRPASTPDREALLQLSNSVGVALERAELLEGQLRLQRELDRQSRMEQLGRTAATVAHNVKNPLSSMKTLLQLMSEADNLTDGQHQEVRMMIREIDRLSRTITDLLRFSSLEGGDEGAGAPASIGLKEFLDGLLTVFRGDIDSKRLQVETHVEPAGAVLNVDVQGLNEIMANLLSNAIGAVPVGGRIEIESGVADGLCRIRVRDSGSGIPSRVRDSLFEPFVTTRSKGTGLGLAIVRKRAQIMGGTVAIVDEPGRPGASFQIEIPLAKEG